MPTLIRKEGFDIRMYFDDHEPPHIHALKAGGQAKIAIGDAQTIPSLILVQTMNAKDSKTAIEIVFEYQTQLLDRWDEYHG